MYARIGAPEMAHRNGQDQDKAAIRVPTRKVFGVILLLSSRSGLGVMDGRCRGTGLRCETAGMVASRLMGDSISSRDADNRVRRES